MGESHFSLLHRMPYLQITSNRRENLNSGVCRRRAQKINCEKVVTKVTFATHAARTVLSLVNSLDDVTIVTQWGNIVNRPSPPSPVNLKVHFVHCSLSNERSEPQGSPVNVVKVCLPHWWTDLLYLFDIGFSPVLHELHQRNLSLPSLVKVCSRPNTT